MNCVFNVHFHDDLQSWVTFHMVIVIWIYFLNCMKILLIFLQDFLNFSHWFAVVLLLLGCKYLVRYFCSIFFRFEVFFFFPLNDIFWQKVNLLLSIIQKTRFNIFLPVLEWVHPSPTLEQWKCSFIYSSGIFIVLLLYLDVQLICVCAC